MRTGFKALLLAVIACGATPKPAAPPPTDEDEIWLYRDRAVVRQRVALVAPGRGRVTARVAIAAGVLASDVVLLDRPDGDVTLTRATADLTVALDAPRAGRYTVALGYVADDVRWTARYQAVRAGDRVTIDGALAIHNAAGFAPRAHLRVIDSELGNARGRVLAVVRAARKPVDTATRDLGTCTLATGESRFALRAVERALRPLVVFDALGPGHAYAGAIPRADEGLGAAPITAPASDALEIVRAPGDRDRLGGEVALGAARGTLYGAPTRDAGGDVLVLGPARGVTGTRERRGWTRDPDRRRITEEVLVALDNRRPLPVEVRVREHLYRGETWTLAYWSAPARKAGAQQIELGAVVPAMGAAKVLYVVVYTW